MTVVASGHGPVGARARGLKTEAVYEARKLGLVRD